MKRVLLLSLAAVLLVVFTLLGNWQLQRRAWKLQLIEQVDRQLALLPVAAPEPKASTTLNAADAYLPVRVRGRFRHDQEAFVQAMTVLGSGYWVLTPFETEEGFTVLINRGFVDPPHRAAESRPPGSIDSDQSIELSGLLRLSEPDGRTLQANQPAADRWYSRDVRAIGERLGVPAGELAPYFIDASIAVGTPTKPFEWPVAGLTVISFRNTHLVYAITWYSLALLCVAAVVIVIRAGKSRAE